MCVEIFIIFEIEWLQLFPFFLFLFLSAWMKPNQIYDYVQYKNQFDSKDDSEEFKAAVEEANDAISECEEQHEMPSTQSDSMDANEIVASIPRPIHSLTLKSIPADDLVNTFNDHAKNLRILFNEGRKKVDRFHESNG